MNDPVGYAIVDVETTVHNNTIGSNKAFPFHPDNRIVLTGVRERISTKPDALVNISSPWATPLNGIGGLHTKVLVGHNFSFDLHYLRKHKYLMMEDDGAGGAHDIDLINWLVKNSIWDTQVAEYILSGQSILYPSLDGCAFKYDADLKDDRLKIIWNAGYQTEDINKEMLSEYLEGDLEATEIVYHEQMKLAEKSGQLPLIQAMNRAVISYHDIEYNGMCIDLDLLSEQKDEVTVLRDVTLDMLKSQLPSDIQDYVNFGSSEQLSVLLFGGVFNWIEKEQVGVYKTGVNVGEPRYRNHKKSMPDPFLKLTPKDEWKNNKGSYNTSDDVFAYLLNDSTLKPLVHQFVGGLQDVRGYEKELNSYYNKIPDLICEGNLIHPNINNTATSTSRLSENQPNLQNISSKGDSKLKKAFVSRWGEEGWIVEADYSQLEVIGLAYSCRDSQLIADIQAGIDMHTVTQRKVQHLLPTHMNDKEQRRLVKGINFGLLYGGGVTKLAKISGLPSAVIKTIKQTLYDTYPGIKEWQDHNVELVNQSKTRLFEKSKGGYPISKGTLWTDTGRVYTFKEGDAFPWQKAMGITTDFNRSQICNYPIQGFATGDIVPTVIGELHQKLYTTIPSLSENCLMINTVHDSIMFDVHEDYINTACNLIKDVMESAPKLMGDVYGMNFDLPLKVEVTKGRNWKEQEVHVCGKFIGF